MYTERDSPLSSPVEPDALPFPARLEVSPHTATSLSMLHTRQTPATHDPFADITRENMPAMHQMGYAGMPSMYGTPHMHMSSSSPYMPMPFHTGLPVPQTNELLIRMETLEKDLCRTKEKLSDVVAELKACKIVQASVSAPRGRDDRYETAIDKLEAHIGKIKGLRSLVEDEELGEDHVRHMQDFPRAAYMWTAPQWAHHQKKGGGTVAIGEEARSGRLSDEQRAQDPGPAYLCKVNGATADFEYYKSSRKYGQDIISIIANEGVQLPDQWKLVNLRLREIITAAIRRRFVLYQLCEDDYKVNLVVNSFYYDHVVRPRLNKDAPTTSVDLKDALFTIDDLDSDSDCVPKAQPSSKTTAKQATKIAPSAQQDSRKRRRAKSPKGAPPKRQKALKAASAAYTAGDDSEYALPATLPQEAREASPLDYLDPVPAGVQSDAILPALGSPVRISAAAKGKQLQGKERRLKSLVTNNVLSMLGGESDDPTDNEEDQAGNLAASTPEPDALLPPASPSSMVVNSGAVTNTNNITASAAPASTIFVSASAVAISSPTATPDRVSRVSRSGTVPPASEAARKPVPKPRGRAKPPTVPLEEDTAQVEESSSSRNKRGPRKSPTWPPAPDVIGTKWYYAREVWLKEHVGGSDVDFDAHYDALDAAYKALLQRQYTKWKLQKSQSDAKAIKAAKAGK